MAETVTTSQIDPTIRPFLQTGLERAQDVFLTGQQPTFFPGQTYISPSQQTLQALQMQEQAAGAASPLFSASQNAFLSGIGAQSAATPLYQSIYGSAGYQPGASIYERAAAGGFAPSTGAFQQLYSQAGAGVPSIYGQVAGGQGAIDTSYLGNLAQQAGMQPASGLYSQVAGGGFQNAAMSPTAQTAMGGFLQGSPYQQQMIQAATRPLVQQFSEQVIPGISSQFSAAGRYGSGAMQRAQGQATESFGRALGDVTAGIVGQDYARERAFQEAAIGQLAGLSQQDLANRLAGAGALESSMRASIGQQAGLFGQGAGFQQQNLATQLAAAGAGESTRQAQLAQQAGLAGQLSNLEQQGFASQFLGAQGLQQAQAAALATQMAAAGGIGETQASDLQRQLAATQLAPSIYQQQLMPSQTLGQVGAAREAIAMQPLQEQMARFSFQQQQPISALQSYLSSVYGNPMTAYGSQSQQMPQNNLMSGLAGAGAGYLGGQALGSFLTNSPFSLTSPTAYGLAGGAAGGLLGFL
jgi:hypothetical protein